MPKLTPKQKLEKENLEWFTPSLFKSYPPQEGEFEEYLNHSERGIPIVGIKRGSQKFNVYSEAKRWRGIIIHELWEDGFYGASGCQDCNKKGCKSCKFEGKKYNYKNGYWPGFYELLKEEDGTPIPEHIKDYIKREIFGGQSRDLIDKIYEEIKLAM